MQFVAGPHRAWPAQLFEADAKNAARRPEFAIDQKPHRDGRRMPAARRQALKRRFPRGGFIKMIGLRIELLGEGEDLFPIDLDATGVEGLARSEIIQVIFDHLTIAPDVAGTVAAGAAC